MSFTAARVGVLHRLSLAIVAGVFLSSSGREYSNHDRTVFLLMQLESNTHDARGAGRTRRFVPHSQQQGVTSFLAMMQVLLSLSDVVMNTKQAICQILSVLRSMTLQRIANGVSRPCPECTVRVLHQERRVSAECAVAGEAYLFGVERAQITAPQQVHDEEAQFTYILPSVHS